MVSCFLVYQGLDEDSGSQIRKLYVNVSSSPRFLWYFVFNLLQALLMTKITLDPAKTRRWIITTFMIVLLDLFMLQLAELWPNGLMDKNGIKRAICRAKERRRALSGNLGKEMVLDRIFSAFTS